MSHSTRRGRPAPNAREKIAAEVRSQAEPAPTVNERWLDAAESCYTRFGLAKTTVEDVARAAGVSRATLYRHFGSRNDLLVGVIARDARRLAAEAAVTIQRFDDVGSWIVEGILLCLREIPRRPMLAMLFAPEEVGAASRLVLTSEQLLAIGADFLRPMFALAGERRLLREGVQIDVLMEWVLRILMSYLTVPSHLARTDAELRQLLRAMILPAVLANAPADPDSEINRREESRDG
jgi:AcrR family transcriptional regulator